MTPSESSCKVWHPMCVCAIIADDCIIGNYVIVKCVADSSSFDLTHYMVFKDGEANIYMGTYTVSEPSIGEVSYPLLHYAATHIRVSYFELLRSECSCVSSIQLRFIFRLTGLEDMYPAYSYGNVADTAGGSAVEGSDVCK